ncbi:MAG: hypothetical protein KY445_14105 [Armatimonadetes bacterium]|nr:hypothetical protein [Armatimonadota bacterium]
MKTRFLLLALTLLFAPFAHAQDDADPPVQTQKPPEKLAPAVRDAFNLLMTSIQDDDYTGFLVGVDDNFKAALTKKMFDTVVAQMAPRQKNGYEAIYLEQLKRGAYTVHLWKLAFQDGGDDILAEMSLKDGKIGGFFLR